MKEIKTNGKSIQNFKREKVARLIRERDEARRERDAIRIQHERAVLSAEKIVNQLMIEKGELLNRASLAERNLVELRTGVLLPLRDAREPEINRG